MTDSRHTRIIGHMVTHNELDRYLKSSVAWLRAITDTVYIYDDQSDDGTYEYLCAAKIPTNQRRPSVPSFTMNESLFRGSAWQLMEDRLQPTVNDWILCIDADEYLVTKTRDRDETRQVLTDNIERAQLAGEQALTFDVKEVFGFTDDTPLVRRDGYWGTIRACRLVRWRPNGVFDNQVEGGGSIPTDWWGPFSAEGISIMHLGYARDEDRRAKHARYKLTTGHNPNHIASILQVPTTIPWPGLTMDWN